VDIFTKNTDGPTFMKHLTSFVSDKLFKKSMMAVKRVLAVDWYVWYLPTLSTDKISEEE
jgi:hypothetical protein